MQSPKIALVIPVHNALFYTKKTLNELTKKIKDENLEIPIIIIDDGSTDGTSQWISSNYPDVLVLQGNGNLWWSGGVNLGVKYALFKLGVDYILLWNNDCYTIDGYFSILIKTISRFNNDKIIIASKIYYSDRPNVIFYMGGIFNKQNGKLVLNARDAIDSENYNKELEVDWTGGMGVLIHKEAFNTIGYFNEKDFPQYYGDCDFFLRAREKGFKIVVCPNLKVWNDRENTAVNNFDNFHECLLKLFSLKSRFNIFIDIKFLNRHAQKPFWYYEILKKYFKYFYKMLFHKKTPENFKTLLNN